MEALILLIVVILVVIIYTINKGKNVSVKKSPYEADHARLLAVIKTAIQKTENEAEMQKVLITFKSQIELHSDDYFFSQELGKILDNHRRKF